MNDGEARRNSRAQPRLEAWLAARARNVPRVSYPPELPITARVDEIVDLHRVPFRSQMAATVKQVPTCGPTSSRPIVQHASHPWCRDTPVGLVGREAGVNWP